MNSRYQSWFGLCLLAALFVPLGAGMDCYLHPNSPALFPITDTDSMLYQTMFYKLSHSSFNEYYIWEHRHDAASIFSFFKFWPSIYGHIYRFTGDVGLLFTSALLTSIWFYSLFRVCVYLGQPKSFAFFASGIQTYFIVTFAYQLYATKGVLFDFSISEHFRLYPTVTAVATFSLALFLTLRFLKRHHWSNLISAAVAVSLTCYGRPHDWMTLLAALFMLGTVLLLQKDKRNSFCCFALLILSGICSLKFVYDYSLYQSTYKSDFLEIISRGFLQVKLWPHYIKHLFITTLVLILMGWTFRKEIFTRSTTNADRHSTIGILFLCSIVAGAFLVHFETAVTGGVTLLGPTYIYVFGVIPWGFFLFVHWLWATFGFRYSGFFDSKRWIFAFFLIFGVYQLSLGTLYRTKNPQLPVSAERMIVYKYLKVHGSPDAVVLSLARGLEIPCFADAWMFFPNPCTASDCTATPNTEILQRFLFAKLLLTGTVNDLTPFFGEEGVSDPFALLKSGNDSANYWRSQLRECVVNNTFIFHPVKNRGELKLRKIELPSGLKTQKDFVGYFTPDLRNVFSRCQGIESNRKESMDLVGVILQNFKLDYIYIPNDFLKYVNVENFARDSRIEEIHFTSPVDGRLWVLHHSET